MPGYCRVVILVGESTQKRGLPQSGAYACVALITEFYKRVMSEWGEGPSGEIISGEEREISDMLLT